MTDITHGTRFRTAAPAASGFSLKDVHHGVLRAAIAVEKIFRRNASRDPDPISGACEDLVEPAAAWRDVTGAWLFCALVAAVALAVVG